MAKIKKFDVISVPVEVEFIKPICGRLFAAYMWCRLVRLKRFNFAFYNFKYPVYRLIVPRFMKGSGMIEE